MNIRIKSYLFIDKLNENLLNNIKIFNNISLILKPFDKNKSYIELEKLVLFCKKNQIEFYFYDNIKLVTKYKAKGIFLSTTNAKAYKHINAKRFSIIGQAHNQLEYFRKENQGCKTIMLSPLFWNAKYKPNKILGIIRFNLISLNWRFNICGLGGINLSNVNKIKTTKSHSIAFKGFFKKKPTYNLM